MEDQEFIDLLKHAIENKGYINLTKRVNEHYKDLNVHEKVATVRKFTYTMIGTGDYAKEDVADGRLLFKSEEYYINRRVVAAHDSTIETNKAVRENIASQDALSKSTVSTNLNIRRSNRVIAGASISTGVFALAAFVISLLSFIDSEKLKPELQQLRQSIQAQEHQLQELALFLRGINHSIQNVADSLSSK